MSQLIFLSLFYLKFIYLSYETNLLSDELAVVRDRIEFFKTFFEGLDQFWQFYDIQG